MFATWISPQVSFFVILLVTLVLLLTERVRNDVVALFIILSLYFTGVLKSDQALSGFSSQPAIVVAAIFVLTGALYQTGLSDTLAVWIGRIAGVSYTRMIAVIMPTVAVLSAFTHHVTITALMLPITLNISRERKIPASKLLMPMSFAASLGTTITIIGAPAFLLASDILQRGGRPGLGIFDIAPIGLALSVVGTIFMLTVGRWLLPNREGGEDATNLFRLDKYLTELIILANSPFIGKTLSEIKDNSHYHFTVVGWLREGTRVRGPFHGLTLQERDILLVRTTPEDIATFRADAGIELHAVEKYGDDLKKQVVGEATRGETDALVQAIVAPNSDLIGRTLGEIDFRRRFGPIAVGLWRRSGWLQEELSKIRLREGDVLLLLGDNDSLARIANDRNFLMLVPFQSESRLRRKAPLAAIIMLATIALATLNVFTLELVSLAGAVAMILTRCITPRQAYRAVDAQIFVFIAGAIPLGAAIETSGTAKLIAGWLQSALQGVSEFIVLLIIFAIVGLVTQLMSDAATTALFAPVALELAKALGHSPEAYVVTVAMAAVAAFLTPIGHHGNLLVYSPGRYKFSDFVKVGTPLTILVGIVVALLAPMLWH